MASKFRAASSPFNLGTPSGRALTLVIANAAVLDECARIAKLTNRRVMAVAHDAIRLGLQVLADQVTGKAAKP